MDLCLFPPPLPSVGGFQPPWLLHSAFLFDFWLLPSSNRFILISSVLLEFLGMPPHLVLVTYLLLDKSFPFSST